MDKARRVSSSGRFSAGKSTFINSFIHVAFSKYFIHFKEGIAPTTAIPSYIVGGDEPNITGIKYRGYKTDIVEETYESISHEMMETFKGKRDDLPLYSTARG